jgi:hypothetical protein
MNDFKVGDKLEGSDFLQWGVITLTEFIMEGMFSGKWRAKSDSCGCGIFSTGQLGTMTYVSELWRKYKSDFDSMTDAEVAQEVSDEQTKLDEAESWLEAVASWEAAGKPRSQTNE